MWAVASLLAVGSCKKVYLEENFSNPWQSWVHPDRAHSDQTTKHFRFSSGNVHVEERFYGLYASEPDSKYAISRILAEPLDPTDQSFSLEFKVLQEEG